MLKTKAICGPADRIGTTWSPMRSAPASRILYMAARRQITTFNRRSPRCWTLSRQGYCRCNSIDQPVYRSPRRNTNKKRVLKKAVVEHSPEPSWVRRHRRTHRRSEGQPRILFLCKGTNFSNSHLRRCRRSFDFWGECISSSTFQPYGSTLPVCVRVMTMPQTSLVIGSCGLVGVHLGLQTSQLSPTRRLGTCTSSPLMV